MKQCNKWTRNGRLQCVSLFVHSKFSFFSWAPAPVFNFFFGNVYSSLISVHLVITFVSYELLLRCETQTRLWTMTLQPFTVSCHWGRFLWSWQKCLLYLFQLGVLLGLVKDLPYGNKHRKHQPCGQHDEDPPDVLHSKSARLFALLLWTAVASPPLLLHHVQLPFLLELKNSYCDLVSVWRACGYKRHNMSLANMFKSLVLSLFCLWVCETHWDLWS